MIMLMLSRTRVGCLREVLLSAFTIVIFSAPVSAREPKTDQGITHQDDATMQWFADARFGMFLHWGVYAVPAHGEWHMEWSRVPIETYRKYATDQGDGVYFDAKEYDPVEWAKLAKDSGMKYMCLTARHHDGFALFDSKHPNAWTSLQTIHRDLYAEYVAACRAAGLRVGLYYSPLSWRYPGYYDVTGTDCKKNKWGYQTDPAHKENARLLKEEVYEQVRTLFRNYGPFDYVFWDGAWLAQQGTDADAAPFWEPGKHRDPANAWPIGPAYSDFDENGRPLGLMGIARKYSPRVICNSRSGWTGDFAVDEGDALSKGPVRKDYWEKCVNLNQVSWGYNTQQKLMTYERLVRYLVDCSVRNGNLLLNFGPDRHGRIPPSHAAITLRIGSWLKVVGDSIYGTRGGPWDPVEGQYGYTYKPGKYFIHILPDYQGSEFTTPAVPGKVNRCFDLYTAKDLPYTQNADGTLHITAIDRQAHLADTVVAVTVGAPK
jgi:alpha-L-fucosidase